MIPRVTKNGRPKGLRQQLILAASQGDSPWSKVNYVKAIEIQGAAEKEIVKIEVDRAEQDGYLCKGPGIKYVNIPEGKLRAVRVKGNSTITIYALCGR